MDRAIYKILEAPDWTAFQAAGVFTGAAVDHADGYIHFSTASQLAETLARHFRRQEGLILLEVPLDRLAGADLRWEAARDSLFPHLYAALPLSTVGRHWPLSLDADGRHLLPDLCG